MDLSLCCCCSRRVHVWICPFDIMCFVACNWEERLSKSKNYMLQTRARSTSSIWNHKYDIRPKLHSTHFSYHFIKSILKSHNFIALNFRFWCNVPNQAKLIRNSRTGNTWTSYLVCKTMSCDKNITSKQAGFTRKQSSKDQSLILVTWINDGRPSFFLWLRLRLLVVFGERIWGCSRCNSAR